LTAVRRMVWRAAFWADEVLAIEFRSLRRLDWRRSKINGPGFEPSLAGPGL
jgi:hypothetical protein